MKRFYCSFCGASDREAKAIVAGNDANICDACVKICAEVIAQHRDGDWRFIDWSIYQEQR